MTVNYNELKMRTGIKRTAIKIGAQTYIKAMGYTWESEKNESFLVNGRIYDCSFEIAKRNLNKRGFDARPYGVATHKETGVKIILCTTECGRNY